MELNEAITALGVPKRTYNSSNKIFFKWTYYDCEVDVVSSVKDNKQIIEDVHWIYNPIGTRCDILYDKIKNYESEKNLKSKSNFLKNWKTTKSECAYLKW